MGNPHGFREDLNDFYKFQVGADSNVKIDLTGLNANADLYLYDSSNRYYDAESETLQKANESITENLTPGTYFIEVQSVNDAETTYNLQLTGTPLPNNAAGDTADKALDLGSLAAPKSASDWVGDIDSQDYYKFTVDGNSTVNLSLTGMSGNASLSVYDSNNTSKGYSYNSGNADENITTNLEAGTYFASVSGSSANTNYDLKLTGTALLNNAAGDTADKALDLGSLAAPKSAKDWVGDIDGTDYYKFTVDGNSTVNLSLTGMSGNASLYVYDSNNTSKGYSYNSGNADENITTNLEAGT